MFVLATLASTCPPLPPPTLSSHPTELQPSGLDDPSSSIILKGEKREIQISFRVDAVAAAVYQSWLMGGVTAGHLGRCTWFIRGASSTPRHQLASLQYRASGADCVAALSRDLREQAWVRAFLVNSGSRHGGSSGRVVPTPTTVRMTHINAHWYCCCNTVTKQQETSHTDHWHCIVIEIWVSIASLLFPRSLSLFPLFLLSQLNTTFSADSSSSTYSCSVTFPLSSALLSRVLYTHPPQLQSHHRHY